MDRDVAGKRVDAAFDLIFNRLAGMGIKVKILRAEREGTC
jgi:hypothetical protein